jgi:hypothetical protein
VDEKKRTKGALFASKQILKSGVREMANNAIVAMIVQLAL